MGRATGNIFGKCVPIKYQELFWAILRYWPRMTQ